MAIGKGCSVCGAFIETIDGGVVMCDECLRRLRGILYPPKKVYCKHCQLNNGKSCEILGVPIVVGGWCSHTDYEWSEEEQAYILKPKQTANGARMDVKEERIYCDKCKYNNGKSCDWFGTPIVVGGWCSHGRERNE